MPCQGWSVLVQQGQEQGWTFIKSTSVSHDDRCLPDSKHHSVRCTLISCWACLPHFKPSPTLPATHFHTSVVILLPPHQIKVFVPVGTEYITKEDAQPQQPSPFDAVGGIGHRAYSAYAIFSSLGNWGSRSNGGAGGGGGSSGGGASPQPNLSNMARGPGSGGAERRASANGLPSFLPFVRRSAASVTGGLDRLMGSGTERPAKQRSNLGRAAGRGAGVSRAALQARDGGTSGNAAHGGREAIGEATEEVGPLHVAAGIVASSRAVMEVRPLLQPLALLRLQTGFPQGQRVMWFVASSCTHSVFAQHPFL